jgi:hypothetical protein
LVPNFSPNPNRTELDRSSVRGSGLGLNWTNGPVQGSGGGQTWWNHSEPGLNPEPEGPTSLSIIVAAVTSCVSSLLPCAPCPHHLAPLVPITLHAASPSPCTSHRCCSVPHIAVALRPSSSLPCMPCHR